MKPKSFIDRVRSKYPHWSDFEVTAFIVNYGSEGGRYVNAITKSTVLDGYQKAVMHCLASQLNYNALSADKTFENAAWDISIPSLVDDTSFSESKVKRVITSLVEAGYVKKTLNFGEDGVSLASTFEITMKIFVEFWLAAGIDPEQVASRVKQGSVPTEPGGGSLVETGGGGVPTDPLGVPTDRGRGSHRPPNTPIKAPNKKKDNTNVLSKKGSAKASKNEKPSTAAQKKWEAKKIVEWGLLMFKPNVKPGRYRPDPGTAMIRTVMTAMYEKYGYHVIKAFYEDISQAGQCGELSMNQQLMDKVCGELKDRLEAEKLASCDEETQKAIADIPW